MHKVFAGTLFVLSLFALTVLTPGTVQADVSPNLVTNPSFELDNGLGKPANWTEAGWGVNVRFFEYLASGAFDGAKSVKVTLSNQLDGSGNPLTLTGDAKWVPDEITVAPGANYVYIDHYRSDVKSRVVVRLNRGTCVVDGTGCTYTELATLPASGAWRKYQVQFSVPDDVVSITVFHLIEGAGFLELDAVSLEEVINITVTDTVPNASVEQSYGEGLGAMPLAWYTDSWGNNTPQFEYVTNDGEEGARSVKVTLSSYTSGDAKWFFEPQAVTAGKDYKFSAWFKSDIAPHVVVQFFKANGAVSYLGLRRPEPHGSDWQKYESEFSVPSGVVKASVFFFIDQVGFVQSDNYSITPFTYEGYDRGLVTLTFDDGAEANYETVLPLVNALGLKTTHCYATEYVEGDQTQITRLMAFYNAGHEICSHTVNHPDLTTVTPQELQYQLTHSKEYLESLIGAPVPNFASPYGKYNEAVNNTIKTIYSAHRTVDEGYNAKNNFDRYRLKVQNMKPTTTLAEFKEWVNKAMADKTWLILVYHDVNDESIGVTPYGTYTPDFVAQMNWLASSTATVKTLQAALDEVTGVVPVCPTGQTLNGNTCEPIVCPTGTTLNGSTCEPITCPTGQTLNGNTCEPIVCDTGTVLQGNACVPITCSTGTVLSGNDCVPIVCQTGFTLNGNSCDPIICSTGTILNGSTCEPIVCSVGTTLQGNACVPITCSTGTVLSGNDCVPIVCGTGLTLVGNTCEPITCPTGQTLNGNTCEPIVCGTGTVLQGNTCEPIVCPTGTILNGNSCDPITCSVGTVLVGNTCEPIVCDTGTVLQGNACVPITCNSGFSLVGNDCVKDPIICAVGTTLTGDTCVPNPIICPAGTTLSGTTCIKNPRRGGGGGSKPKPKVVIATTTPTGTVLGIATSTTGAGATTTFARNLKLGMSGDDVSALQRKLIELGFYTGPVTGYYGPLTEEAVKAYQRSVGIPATGLLGVQTRAKLNGAGASSLQVGGEGDPSAQGLAFLLARIKELQAQLAALKQGTATPTN